MDPSILIGSLSKGAAVDGSSRRFRSSRCVNRTLTYRFAFWKSAVTLQHIIAVFA
jgi:hypothetical protein